MSEQITHWKETCEPHDCNLHVPSHHFLHPDHWVTATLTPGTCSIYSTKLIYWLQNYVIPFSDFTSSKSLFYLLSVIIIRCLIITAGHLNLIYCQWKTRSFRQVSQVPNRVENVTIFMHQIPALGWKQPCDLSQHCCVVPRTILFLFQWCLQLMLMN